MYGICVYIHVICMNIICIVYMCSMYGVWCVCGTCSVGVHCICVVYSLVICS